MNEFKSAGNDAYITTVHQTVESFFIERYGHFFYLRVWCTPRYVLEIGSWFGNCRHMDAMDVDQDKQRGRKKGKDGKKQTVKETANSKKKDVETVTEEETTKENETGMKETDRENEAGLVKETAREAKETETASADAQPAKRRRQQRCV